jgi:hypothetical protein
MFYVLFMCKCVLPPGVKAIAVDKYINIYITLFSTSAPEGKESLNNINPSVVSNSRTDVIRETLIVGILVKKFPVILTEPRIVSPCPPYCKRH